MVFNRQSLFICAVFIVLCLLQLGRMMAGDTIDDSAMELALTKVAQVVGIIGLFGTILTLPLMFVAAFLEKIFSVDFNTSFKILYLLLGILVVSSKMFKNIINEQGNVSLVVYLTAFSLFQFVFDYIEKIRENKIAAGLARLDALDALGTMIFLSFSLVSSLAISFIVMYLIKKK